MAQTATHDLAKEDPALYRRGVFLVTMSTLAFSTTGFFTRLITVDAWTILFWRGLFGALFIAVYIVWVHRRATGRVISAMGWPGVVVIIASTVTMVAYIPALKLTTVANATLIAATVPFFSALLAWVWLRERPTVSAALASAVAFLGVVVMMRGSTSVGSRWGDALAVVANMAFATAVVVMRQHRGILMVPAACLAALLGTIVSMPFASPWATSVTDLGYLVLFGFVQMTLGLTLFTIGSRLIPAVATALIGALDAPLGPWWVWLAFGEVPAAVTFLGGVLVLSAVLGHIVAEARPKATHVQASERRR